MFTELIPEEFIGNRMQMVSEIFGIQYKSQYALMEQAKQCSLMEIDLKPDYNAVPNKNPILNVKS